MGDGLIDTVNARDLHRGLGSKRQFTNWLDQRLEACGFKENEDYVVFNGGVKNPLGGRPSREVFLTLDAAKHFAMLERNEVGHAVRTYFIEHEKQAKQMLPVFCLASSQHSSPAPRHRDDFQVQGQRVPRHAARR